MAQKLQMEQQQQYVVQASQTQQLQQCVQYAAPQQQPQQQYDEEPLKDGHSEVVYASAALEVQQQLAHYTASHQLQPDAAQQPQEKQYMAQEPHFQQQYVVQQPQQQQQQVLQQNVEQQLQKQQLQQQQEQYVVQQPHQQQRMAATPGCKECDAPPGYQAPIALEDYGIGMNQKDIEQEESVEGTDNDTGQPGQDEPAHAIIDDPEAKGRALVDNILVAAKSMRPTQTAIKSIKKLRRMRSQGAPVEKLLTVAQLLLDAQ